MTEMLTRDKVNKVETWDLSSLFADDSSWELEFSKLPHESDLTKKLEEKYKNRLGSSAQLLFEALEFRDSVLRKISNLYVYSGLRVSEDVGNENATKMSQKCMTRYSELSACFAFYRPEMLLISDLSSWVTQAPLNAYKVEISELLRKKPHVLTDREEFVIQKMSGVLGKFKEIHSKFNDVDIKFESVPDTKGDMHSVSHSRYITLMSSSDRVLRKNAYLSVLREYGKSRQTLTANYGASLQAGSVTAQLKNYPSFLEMSLFGDAVPLSVYDGLIAATRKNISALHRSINIRKRIFKLDSVCAYDRTVSMCTATPTHFTWNQACELILKSLAPLGEEYVSIARKGLLKERWADYCENIGKRSGAFSWGTHDSKPYMLMSWTGCLRNVYTLAHELGHSMHSYYSRRNQPLQTSGYAIFVAEVASTLNEALLSEYILKTQPGTTLASEVISDVLQGFEGTALRQTLFAAFEREASKQVDAGHGLTPEFLEDTFMKLNTDWFGADASFEPESRFEWMRIPHFYTNFYVYKYATSFCASLSLLEDLKKDESSAQKKILQLLSAGGSKLPMEILNDAGVDFTTPTPVTNAFAAYSKNLDQAEKHFLGSSKLA